MWWTIALGLYRLLLGGILFLAVYGGIRLYCDYDQWRQRGGQWW